MSTQGVAPAGNTQNRDAYPCGPVEGAVDGAAGMAKFLWSGSDFSSDMKNAEGADKVKVGGEYLLGATLSAVATPFIMLFGGVAGAAGVYEDDSCQRAKTIAPRAQVAEQGALQAPAPSAAKAHRR